MRRFQTSSTVLSTSRSRVANATDRNLTRTGSQRQITAGSSSQRTATQSTVINNDSHNEASPPKAKLATILEQIELLKQSKPTGPTYKPLAIQYAQELRDYDSLCAKTGPAFERQLLIQQRIKQIKQNQMMAAEDRLSAQTEKIQLVMQKEEAQQMLGFYRQQHPEQEQLATQIQAYQEEIKALNNKLGGLQQQIVVNDQRCIQWQRINPGPYGIRAQKNKISINKLQLVLFEKEAKLSEQLRKGGCKKIRQLICLFVQQKIGASSAQHIKEVWICEQKSTKEFRDFSLKNIAKQILKKVESSFQEYFKTMMQLQQVLANQGRLQVTQAQNLQFRQNSDRLQAEVQAVAKALQQKQGHRQRLSQKLQLVLAEELELLVRKSQVSLVVSSEGDYRNSFLKSQLKEYNKMQQSRLTYAKKARSILRTFMTNVQRLNYRIEESVRAETAAKQLPTLKKQLKEIRSQLQKIDTQKQGLQKQLSKALSKNKKKQSDVYSQALTQLYLKLGKAHAKQNMPPSIIAQAARPLPSKPRKKTTAPTESSSRRHTTTSSIPTGATLLKYLPTPQDDPFFRQINHNLLKSQLQPSLSSLANTDRQLSIKDAASSVSTNRQLLRQSSKNRLQTLTSAAGCSIENRTTSATMTNSHRNSCLVRSESYAFVKPALTNSVNGRPTVYPRTKLSELILNQLHID